MLVARHVERDDHFYAGPFLPASLARRTMSLSHKLFGIRSCNEVITGERGRPCLEFDIKRCVAPCVREICSEDEYRVAVEHTRLFLEGRNEELVTTLKDRMVEAASAERFEQAAQLRDAIRTIETLQTRQQKMATVAAGRPRRVRRSRSVPPARSSRSSRCAAAGSSSGWSWSPTTLPTRCRLARIRVEGGFSRP